jgi:gliding motility-associated-like protein
MRYLISILILLISLPEVLLATHNRAGEITYRHIGGYTYEFTVTTYTYIYSNANRSELPVEWGDGTSTIVPLLTPPGHYAIPNTDYYKNIYIATHTFPGPGVYKILMQDPNRNQGVVNIPNSVNTIFSIETTMLIGSDIGANNTPILLNPPIDKAAKGHIFVHNPAAYDPDGDSLSYAITVCTGANGEPIEGYVLPAATDTLYIDEIRGDLWWITPADVGKYNIAILVEEWRKGIRIGRIERDMQIDVHETKNHEPVNPDIPDFCVLAGDSIEIPIHSTDADGDQITQDMVGGPFEVDNPAVFQVDSSGYGWIYSHFKWKTDCSDARKQPYDVVLKSEDINADISLVDITSFQIRVLHKPPENLVALPGTDTIRLEWNPTNCGKAAGYNIYRRLGSQAYTPDSCEIGVPAYTGYELIDKVTGSNTTHYRDDNHGGGLVPGYNYCYRITAYYNDGAESISSDEVCTTLVPGTPPILEVSVLSDDEETGQIELAWALPRGVTDTITGPYRYEVQRMLPDETAFTTIATIPTADLTDTVYTDSDINTITIFPYTYTIILYHRDNTGNWVPLPGNEIATSQYIEIAGADNQLTLNMKKRAPWLNEQYNIYRMNSAGVFQMIDSTTESVYIDKGLRNNNEYTYRTIGLGKRPLYGTEFFVRNTSHLAKGIPIDTIPPCPPDLYVTSECDSVIGYNYLTWEPPVDTCALQDVIGYIVYSRDSLEGEFTVLDTLPPDVFQYQDVPEHSIEKCYAVTAIDSSYNESKPIPFCVYNICGLYRLPNVFTPNGDGINDIYLSWNLNGYIKKVNMKIYNRYGKEMFATANPDIKWDGRYNDKLVSTGVYYYICDVYEPRINGTLLKTLSGFIHVYSGKDNVRAE